jgi:2,3-diaminopropionate biosynthesis protein SbnB
MVYLNEEDLLRCGVDWEESVNVIERAVRCLNEGDFVQPIKPYLRFGDKRNRIIAMPAFLGGPFHIAGIKWIASFPANVARGIPRAHSVVILNNAETGEPVAIINTAMLSIVRTASVSGLILRFFDKARRKKNLTIGIVGLGPIGMHHLKICLAFFSDRVDRIILYDQRQIKPDGIDPFPDRKITIAESWQEAYLDADIFITCTVAVSPYINLPPKKGSLHLNVSLRDYTSAMIGFFRDAVIVDDWDEICREGTDIERMHLEQGLTKEMTRSIGDVVGSGFLESLAPDVPVFFNPMGMAVFDVAMAKYYYEKSCLSHAVKNINSTYEIM